MININYAAKLTGEIRSSSQTLNGNLTTSLSTVTGSLVCSTVSREMDPYEGPYEVTPIFAETIQEGTQTLSTNEKRMTNNVTVYGVRYARVSNTAGGDTVTIGGN